MTANVAFAPNCASPLYDAPGIDLMLDPDVAAGYETQGAATHVEWIEYEGDAEVFDPDEMLADAGFRRVSEWVSVGEYSTCSIEEEDDED